MYITRTKYFQNGFDVTHYVMRNVPTPISERFFDITAKDVQIWIEL